MTLPNPPATTAGFTVPFSSSSNVSSSNVSGTTDEKFVDRREVATTTANANQERRQFGNSHSGLSEAGRDLALAIDRYKIERHRRYLTCDEMLEVMNDLGYAKA